MVLCGDICSSGFYSDDFHVQGAKVARRKGKKKDLSQMNVLARVGELQSVSHSVAKTLKHLFLVDFFFGAKI